MIVTTNFDFNVVSLTDSVILICNSSGGPNNTYQWMKDGMILDGDVLMLNIISASIGGDYICNVSNSAGTDSGNATLYVAPYLASPLDEEVLTTNGSTVNITCPAEGFPSPDVLWEKVEMNATRRVVSTTSLLEMNPVVFGDEGVYRCVATTEIGGMMFSAINETTLIGTNINYMLYTS